MKRIFRAVLTVTLACCLTLSVCAASPVQNVQESETRALADGSVQLTTLTADAAAGTQTIYNLTVAANKGYSFVIGGSVGDRALVQDMASTLATQETAREVVAGVNGDHFSFSTGVPLGMSISDGRLITDPVAPEEADEYYFYVLGITADGTVLTGQSPTLNMTYTLGGETYTIDRLNRTRESWSGGQLCLYTPDYGDSTGTNAMGIELIVRVDEGAVEAGSTMTGTIVAINEDDDSPLEDGTVVLSAYALRMMDLNAEVGDTVEFSFSFEEEEWNDVVFAVGGNSVIVEQGEPQYYDYTLDVFAAAQPRTALGVREDGTLVLTAVDGRSEISNGMTANEMADYMANDMDCAYALLLDGGGSTALVVTDGNGGFDTVNVPSEERPVGNGVFVVWDTAAAAGAMPVWVWIVVGAAGVILLMLVGLLLVKKRPKTD